MGKSKLLHNRPCKILSLNEFSGHSTIMPRNDLEGDDDIEAEFLKDLGGPTPGHPNLSV
jgi:hypothetical protein